MLINYLSIISGDQNINPLEILTTWGSKKIRKIGLQIKRKLWIETLWDSYYYSNTQYIEEMVIWDNKKKNKRGTTDSHKNFKVNLLITDILL